MTTIAELAQVLDHRGVDPRSYSINGQADDEQYRLELSGDRFIVFYAERGLRTGEQAFSSEADACSFFLELILSDPATRLQPPGPLLTFVRGESSRGDLARLGIKAGTESGRLHVVTGPLGFEDADAGDILCGARRWRDNPTELQAWAQLVLAISAINLDLDDSSRSDQLTLELVWDMADGHVPTELQLSAIEELRVAESGRTQASDDRS